MRLEKKATVVSTSVAAVLVLFKMTVGIMSGSIAVLASAIDSLLDLIVSAFNYFALNSSEKAPDERFNFGRSKLEPLAAVIEGTIISISALFIMYNAFINIFHGKELSYMHESIVVMGISIVITALLVLFLNFVAKKTDNMVIRADALHYKTDLYSNAAVLAALFLVTVTGEKIIDSILGLGISVYMLISAYPIIKDGILMLMDIAIDAEDLEKIKRILQNEDRFTSYHHLQTRESGSDIFVNVHIVFDETISLLEAHNIADDVEEKIRNLFEDKTVHVFIHLDPYDDSVTRTAPHSSH